MPELEEEAEAQASIAKDAYAVRDWLKAAAAAEKALQIKSDEPRFYVIFARSCVNLAQFEKAEQAWQRAIALKPQVASWHAGLGLACEKQGKPSEAIAAYGAALNCAPDKGDQASYQAKIASCLVKMTEYKKAVDAWQRAIAANPQRCAWHAGLAFSYKKLGELGDAARAYREAISCTEEPSDRAKYQAMLARCLAELGEFENAETAWQSAIAINSRESNWHAALGSVLQAQGKLRDAARAYREAINCTEVSSDRAKYQAMLARCLAELGEFENAETAWQSAIALNSREGNWHAALGSVLQAQGKLRDAARAYREAISSAKGPKDRASYHAMLARCLTELAELDEAKEAWQCALALDSTLTHGVGAIGFRTVLNSLRLPASPSILDVGAGGFLGSTTTVHLAKVPGARTDAVELVPELARKLDEKFAGQINVVNDDFLSYPFNKRYDLVCLDLDSGLIPALFENWLPGKVKEVLNPTGAVIVLCFGYAPKSFSPEFGLAEESQMLANRFLPRYFGTNVLTPDLVNAVFEKNTDYRFVSMAGKEFHDGRPETIVWIGLQRRASKQHLGGTSTNPAL
jgi:tetratricopeptide (TPR) repeat protein